MSNIFRHILVSILGIIVCTASYGKVVAERTCEETASKFLGSSVSCVWSPSFLKAASSNGAASAPAFKVFQGKDRWVIIAGDDCAVPVLAYGEGRFPSESEMPDNMREYLESLGKEIIWARNSGIKADEETTWQWAHIGEHRSLVKSPSAPSVVGPLTEGILWNQDSPYNGKTPMFNGSHAPTGCVATAVAIVMYYNRWPEYGKGVIDAYTTASKKVAMPALDIDGYKYDWDVMPDKLTSSSSDAAKEAVSTLMLHVGCMLKMDYCPDASGTYPDRIIAPLTKNMSYKKSCTLLYASDFSHEEWFYMIKRELDAGRLIIYNAASSSAGHCMVCDGYDESTRMVSANWGWGYTQRGWYVLNTMNGIHKGWPVEHNAIFGLEPDYDGSGETGFKRFFFNINEKGGGYGLQLSDGCGDIRNRENFSVKLNQMDNKDKAASVKLRMVLVGRDAEEKENVSDQITVDLTDGKGGTMASFVTDIPCSMSDGCVIGDRIRCYYYYPDNLRWYPAGRWKTSVMHEIGAYDLDFIYFPSVMRAWQVYYPEFVYGGHLPYKSIVWYYDGEPMEERFPSVILEAGKHTVKAVVTYVDDSVRTIIASCQVTE